MTFKKITLLLFSLLLIGGCEKLKSHFVSLTGMDEEINTILQSDWEKEGDDLFAKLTLEDDETPNLDLEMASPPPIQVAPLLVAKEPKAVAKKENKSTLPYIVQVGAFKSGDNAKNFAAKLNKRGFKAQVTKADGAKGNTWYVVRLGQSSQLNKALALAQKYSDQNSSKSMILKNLANYKTISPREVEVADNYNTGGSASKGTDYSAFMQDSNKPSPNKPYTVQIGGLYEKSHATKLLKFVKRKKLKPYLMKVQDSVKVNWWWTVRIGHFYNTEEAQEKADHLSSLIKVPLKVTLNAKKK
ncbi:MAG: SPOR domain-containing protein [SAR324 cluster bacterium]|nr:SPOR domain-containing protein [SAR324 cluster bacterium]